MESNVCQIISVGDYKLTSRRKGNLDHKQVIVWFSVQTLIHQREHNTKFTYFTTRTPSVASILECGISGNINQENQPKEYQRHYYFKKGE